MHPHALRHNFVTICKRDYELADETVKYLIGHAPDSTVMETTYSHLSGSDHVKRAEEAFGIRDPEPESTFTPDICNVCGEPLGPTAKACEACGAVFTPDAVDASKQIQRDMGASLALSDELTQADLEEIAEDDALLAKLIEIRSAG